MTVQYAQQNINNPGKARIVDGDDVITLDDDVIEIDSGNPNLLLPDARTIPSKELVIKSSSGTGTVFGDPELGQTIDGAASFAFTLVNEALFLKSNGSDWIVASTDSGSGGSALEVQDEGVTIDPNVDVINFVGAGVTVSPVIAGTVQVSIPGGGSSTTTLEEATLNTGAAIAGLGGSSGPTSFQTQIQDGSSMSWATAASQQLLAVLPGAGGDIVRIGFGTGDTLDVNTAAVDIDTNGYSMESTGAFLVRGGSASTMETTGVTSDLTIRTTGSGSSVNIQTTDTTSATAAINITAADNASGAGNSVFISSGSSTGGLSQAGGTIALAAGDGGPSAGLGGAVTVTGGSGGPTGNGGPITISGGDGGATSGNGAAVNIVAGDAPTSGTGGSVLLTAGGSGNNLPGQVSLSLSATGTSESNSIATFINPGTNGESFSVYSGQSDPNGVVTALAGSLWSRDNGTAGELYLNTSAAGSGTTWEQVVTGSVTVSLQSAYDGGATIATSTGTDIAFSGGLGDGGFTALMQDQVAIQSLGSTGSTLPPIGPGGLTLIGAEIGVFLGTSDTAGTGSVNLLTNGTSLSLPTDTDSGDINVRTGETSGTGDSGNFFLLTGIAAGTGNSGGVTVGTGPASSSGAIILATGDSSDSGGGNIALVVGNAGGDSIGGGLIGSAGPGSGGGDGGQINWTTGSGDVSGDGGQYLVTTGDGGASGGSGGNAIINCGDAMAGDSSGGGFGVNCGNGFGNGNGGAVGINSGNGGTSGNAGPIAINGGDGGATLGNGANIVLAAGNSTNGGGGDVSISAGSSATTGAAGSVTIQSGGSGDNTVGIIALRNTASGHTEDDPVVQISNQGTNGQTFNIFGGTSAPTVDTLTGSLWIRDDNSTGEIYINTSAGGSGTTWTQLAAGGGGNSLQQAYVQGNTITTSAAEGNLSFSGTEQFTVDMDDDVSIRSAGTSLSVINDNTAGTGTALFGTGTTTGGSASGSVNLASGSGGTGSSTGSVTVNSGSIVTGAGDTGPLILQSGNATATATGSTGAVTLQSGTSAAASAGAVTVQPGSSGSGSGAALNLAGGAGDTTGGNVNITGGASNTAGAGGNVLVSGGAPTAGAGGSVQITGEDGAGTNQSGGSIILVPGAATGTGTDGAVVVLSSLANTSPVLVLNNSSGTDGNEVRQFVSETQPETVVAAPSGSVCYVDNGGTDTDGEMWLKVSGTGNTGWEQVSTSSDLLTRVFVQGAANTNVTAGNDVSNDAPASNVTMDFGTFPTFPTPQATFNTRVEVWVNGVLQRNGVNVTLGTNPTSLQFSFDIMSGDYIQIQQWSA